MLKGSLVAIVTPMHADGPPRSTCAPPVGRVSTPDAASATSSGVRFALGCAEQVEPKAALQLRQKILQATTPHRERFRPPQGLPPHLHSLRQVSSKLPRLGLPRGCYRMVDLMSLDPRYRAYDAVAGRWLSRDPDLP